MAHVARAEDLRATVFAAASLRGALDTIAAEYEAEVALSFGGSGAMARQIAAGAPADVVVLANPIWMDWLTDQGHISQAQVIASNTLVVIGPANTAQLAGPQDILPRLGGGRLAMGQRDAVPAGSYAQEWLRGTGVWDSLSTRLAETDNVRAALALVARGEAPLGVVYATDAQAEPRVATLYAVPPAAHSPIRYPAAALSPAGQAFVDHLTSDAAQQIFARHGFAAP